MFTTQMQTESGSMIESQKLWTLNSFMKKGFPKELGRELLLYLIESKRGRGNKGL